LSADAAVNMSTDNISVVFYVNNNVYIRVAQLSSSYLSDM